MEYCMEYCMEHCMEHSRFDERRAQTSFGYRP